VEGADLIEAFRQRTDDCVEPHLFPESDILRWASEAEREACLRAKLIFDRTKPSVCLVRVLPGITMYTLHPLIMEVSAVYLDRTAQFPGWQRKRLGNVDQSNAHRHRRSRDYGNCGGFVDDFRAGTGVHRYSIDGNTLQLYGTPDSGYDPTLYPQTPYSVLRLEVYRLPLDNIETPADQPEIPAMHQDGLVDWMLYRAYSSKDGEELDDQRATNALALFTQRFGERPSANQVRMQAEGRRWTTSYGGL
jgi:hypothetical protein